MKSTPFHHTALQRCLQPPLHARHEQLATPRSHVHTAPLPPGQTTLTSTTTTITLTIPLTLTHAIATTASGTVVISGRWCSGSCGGTSVGGLGFGVRPPS